MTTPLRPDDLTAAVSAGLVSERQAASLAAFAETRAGLRARMPKEDEPFELFRGLNEIFVATGIVLLIAGGVALFGVGGQSLMVASGGGLALCWLLAEYFTARRRMVLPSIVLACGTAIFAMLAVATLTMGGQRMTLPELETEAAASVGAGAAAAGAFFLRFRLPFAVFLTGLLCLPPIITLSGALGGSLGLYLLIDDPSRAFDLTAARPLAMTMLGFGLLCFALAMAFDLRDPHRVSRVSRCGFWLHLLAAPAIVNTLALTLWRTGTGPALATLTAVIALMIVVALVIDRRSFLLSAVAYVGLVVALSLEHLAADVAGPATLLILGAGVTALGAGWTSLRGRLMRALPSFPGKAYLPPYRMTEDAAQ